MCVFVSVLLLFPGPLYFQFHCGDLGGEGKQIIMGVGRKEVAGKEMGVWAAKQFNLLRGAYSNCLWYTLLISYRLI